MRVKALVLRAWAIRIVIKPNSAGASSVKHETLNVVSSIPV